MMSQDRTCNYLCTSFLMVSKKLRSHKLIPEADGVDCHVSVESAEKKSY